MLDLGSDQLWKMGASGQTDLTGCVLTSDNCRENVEVQEEFREARSEFGQGEGLCQVIVIRLLP